MRGRPNLFDAYFKKLSAVGDYIELPKRANSQSACQAAYHFKRNRHRNTKGITISIKQKKNGTYIAQVNGFLEKTLIKDTNFFEIDKSEFHQTGEIDSDNITHFGKVKFSFTPDYYVSFDLKSKDGVFIFDNISALNHYDDYLDEHMDIDKNLKEKIIHKLFAE